MTTSPPNLHPPSVGPRLVVYHQTFHTPDGTYHSLLPLLTQPSGVTHVILAAIHLNDGPGNITLNDHRFDDKRYDQLWGEVQWLQGSGVKVLGMLGGAAKGSFERLGGDDESFEAYYHPLHTLITRHHLNGLDLDIEEEVPLSTPNRLITRLRADFGPSFLITLAPVATALLPDPNIPPHLRPPRPMLTSGPQPNALHPTLPHLSGFSYPQLECSPAGREVDWYNTQFYCGWGDARGTTWYDTIIAAGWPAHKIVLGVVTNPQNGAGFVELRALASTCAALRAKYHQPPTDMRPHDAVPGDRETTRHCFGGVMLWEYFNAGQAAEDAIFLSSLHPVQSHPQTNYLCALSRPLRSTSPPSLAPDTIRALLAAIRTPAPPYQTQPPPPTPWPPQRIHQLLVLGFSHDQVIAALDATGGQVERAAAWLCEL